MPFVYIIFLCPNYGMVWGFLNVRTGIDAALGLYERGPQVNLH